MFALRLLLACALWDAAGSQAQTAAYCARQAGESPALFGAAPEVVTQLQRRRDPRALALADHLLAQSAEADRHAARERLQERARASTDPMLTVLALHTPCLQPGCRNIEGSQWSRLEPANLLAWLALPTRSGGDGRYLLEQIATQARYSRSYRQEAAALLNGLASAPVGFELAQPWALANLGTLAGVCHRRTTEVDVAQHCETVARLLWADGEATERLAALILAQHALALLPARREAWEPRLRELEAVTRWLGHDRTPSQPATRAAFCAAVAPVRAGERSSMGEWERAAIVLSVAGLSMRDLAPRSRGDAMRPPR